MSHELDRAKRLGHWQAIAEQLGLSDDRPQPPAPKDSPGEASMRAPAVDESRTRDQRSEQHQEVGEGQLQKSAETESDFDPAGEYQSEDQQASEEAPKETRSAGRRRRRRRASARQQDEPEQDSASFDEQDEDLDQESEAILSPNQPPHLSAEEEDLEDVMSEEPEEELEPAAAEAAGEDDDEEETINYTTWNIPSWTEIIASLYRPER